MIEIAVELPDKLFSLDVCTRCFFVWFDPLEYEAIPPQKKIEKSDEKELPQAAREAIALYQVQRIAEQAQDADPLPDEGWKTVPAVFGLPVEMNSDPLSCIPWTTILLSLAISVVSIWAFFDLKDIVQQFGLTPSEAWKYGGLTFFTSFFLHGSIFHLVSNLYFLIIFGMHVENYLGRGRWVMLVILSAMLGNFVHVMADPHGNVPCIGASGGISGLIAFYALKFPHAKLGILMRFGFLFKWIQIPAWGAFVLWLLLQFWGAYKQIAGFSNISSLAHLGGTATGVALWIVWNKIELHPLPARELPK